MLRSVKSRAEEQFAAALKKVKPAQNEKETARQKSAEHMAGLRALRLAKEVSDKNAAEKSDAKNKKP